MSHDLVREELRVWIDGLEEYFDDWLASPISFATISLEDRIKSLARRIEGLKKSQAAIRAAVDLRHGRDNLEELDDLHIELSNLFEFVAFDAVADSIAVYLAVVAAHGRSDEQAEEVKLETELGEGAESQELDERET